jgi:hypothetical protein
MALVALVGCKGDVQGPPDEQAPPVCLDGDDACARASVIELLSYAYERRSYPRFSSLMHDDFVFIPHLDPGPDPSLPPPLPQWGRIEELRIHRRMFNLTMTPVEETPVPVSAVSINLLESQPWAEVTEYYRGPSNPNGLDPKQWRVWGAEYSTLLMLEIGEIGYQVDARAWFVIAQDLTKPLSEPGSVLLYRWQDLGNNAPAAASRQSTWSRVKLLYGGRRAA